MTFTALLLSLIIATCMTTTTMAMSTFTQGGMTHQLEEIHLEDALKSADFVVVKFVAPWCGHCVRFSPVFDAAAGSLREDKSVRFFSVDGTTELALALQFGVQSFPKVFGIDTKTSNVFEFTQARTMENVVSFATKKEHKDRENPQWFGPFSTFGVLKLRVGRVIQRGVGLYKTLTDGASTSVKLAVVIAMMLALALLIVVAVWITMAIFHREETPRRGGGGGVAREHTE